MCVASQQKHSAAISTKDIVPIRNLTEVTGTALSTKIYMCIAGSVIVDTE